MGFLWVDGFSFFHCVASSFHSFVTPYIVSAHSGQMQPGRTTAHFRASTVPPVPSALSYQKLCMYHLVSFILRSVGSNGGCVVPSHTQTRAQTVPIDSRTVSKFPNCVHVTHAYVRIYFAPVAATVLQHCCDYAFILCTRKKSRYINISNPLHLLVNCRW